MIFKWKIITCKRIQYGENAEYQQVAFFHQLIFNEGYKLILLIVIESKLCFLSIQVILTLNKLMYEKSKTENHLTIKLINRNCSFIY